MATVRLLLALVCVVMVSQPLPMRGAVATSQEHICCTHAKTSPCHGCGEKKPARLCCATVFCFPLAMAETISPFLVAPRAKYLARTEADLAARAERPPSPPPRA